MKLDSTAIVRAVQQAGGKWIKAPPRDGIDLHLQIRLVAYELEYRRSGRPAAVQTAKAAKRADYHLQMAIKAINDEHILGEADRAAFLLQDPSPGLPCTPPPALRGVLDALKNASMTLKQGRAWADHHIGDDPYEEHTPPDGRALLAARLEALFLELWQPPTRDQGKANGEYLAAPFHAFLQPCWQDITGEELSALSIIRHVLPKQKECGEFRRWPLFKPDAAT